MEGACVDVVVPVFKAGNLSSLLRTSGSMEVVKVSTYILAGEMIGWGFVGSEGEGSALFFMGEGTTRRVKEE